MTSKLWGNTELRHLLESEDIFDGAFECYRRIWSTEDAFNDKYLADREYRTRLLEYELYTQYPDLYDEMASRIGDHPIASLESGCGIILDALSIREGFQLFHDLTEAYDWTVNLTWAAAHTLPTDTEFIAGELFGANGGKQASQLHENVTYVGEPEVPQLPDKPLEYVWSRFPDKRLHGAKQGQYTLTELTEIYTETKQVLIDIINESGHSEFLVSSDHGYVNFSGNSPYALSDTNEGILSNKFTNRYTEVTNSGVLRELEKNDITYRTHGHYLIQGHYRAGSSTITHGGFSIPEVMTPVLTIDTNGGTPE